MKNVVCLLVLFYWDAFLMNMQLDVWEVLICLFQKSCKPCVIYSFCVIYRIWILRFHSHVLATQCHISTSYFIWVWKRRSCSWITTFLMTHRQSDSTYRHIILSFHHSAYKWDFVWLCMTQNGLWVMGGIWRNVLHHIPALLLVQAVWKLMTFGSNGFSLLFWVRVFEQEH